MKIIYDSALKEKLLAEDKVIMESVIPKMVAFKSVMGIRGIQYAKAEEMKKAKEKRLKNEAIKKEKKLQEMAARNKAREEAIRNRPVGFHPIKNIDFNSPEAQKARRDWGLNDDIGLGR